MKGDMAISSTGRRETELQNREREFIVHGAWLVYPRSELSCGDERGEL